MSDELQIVLSRRGKMGWPTFRRHIEELTSRTSEKNGMPPYLHTQTIMILQALGHVMVDFSDGEGVVSVAPRVLARLPESGRPRAIVAGHRTSDVERSLRDACEAVTGAGLAVTEVDRVWKFIPRRIAVEANSEEDLATIADAIEARFDPEPAAWRILQVAATLDDYRSSLEWGRQKDVNWETRRFDPQAVIWKEGQKDADGLSEFTDPLTRRRLYRLRRKDLVAEVERHWGCYMILSFFNKDVILFDGGAVFIPVGARLPAPYEAGLSLCSGYAPRLVSLDSDRGGPTEFLEYQDVPRALADLAAAKLGQRIVLSPPNRRHPHDTDGPARGV